MVELKKNIPAHMAVLCANLLYGANYTIAKEVMPEYIAPFGFIFIRVICTAAIFLMLGLVVTREKVENKDLIKLAFCALFGVAINQLLFFKGLNLTMPINASLMMTTNPIMVLIVASLIIREKITIKKVSGIIIGIAGALILLVPGKTIEFNASTAWGDFLILINSLSFGVFLILVKPMMNKYNTITVMKWVFLFGTILVTPFGWSEFSSIQWDTFHTNIWLAVLYVVIGTTSLAYMLNTFALKNLSPSSVSIYIYLQPLFATLFAIMLQKDSLKELHIFAAALIFTGVYLVTSGKGGKLTGRFLSSKKA